MEQISYQAAFDPFNAAYRFLRIITHIGGKDVISVDTIRILDFFLLFPFRIDEVRLTKSHLKYKRLSSLYKHTAPYGGIPESRQLFDRMESMQAAGLETLAHWGLIEANELSTGRVIRTPVEIPEDIRTRIAADNKKEDDLLEFLKVLATYPLTGDNGLKARTGLLEHRYDAL